MKLAIEGLPTASLHKSAFELRDLLELPMPPALLKGSAYLSHDACVGYLLDLPVDFISRLPRYVRDVESLYFAVLFDRVPSM